MGLTIITPRPFHKDEAPDGKANMAIGIIPQEQRPAPENHTPAIAGRASYAFSQIQPRPSCS